jgi:hypothetical protein
VCRLPRMRPPSPMMDDRELVLFLLGDFGRKSDDRRPYVSKGFIRYGI